MIELISDSDPTRFLRADGTWATPDCNVGALTILTIMFGAAIVSMIGVWLGHKILEYRRNREAKFTPHFEPRMEQTFNSRPLMSAEQYLVREFDRVHTHNRRLVQMLDEDRERMKDLKRYLRDPDFDGAELIRLTQELKTYIPEKDFERLICLGQNLRTVTPILYPPQPKA